MKARFLFRSPIIVLILVLQVIPLLLFPAEVFAPGSQEWWLPALLSIMALLAALNVFIRRGAILWPWILIAFTQGINVISRLMLVWPQGSQVVKGVTVMDWQYILMTFLAIAMSVFLLWYMEKPQVRVGLLRG